MGIWCEGVETYSFNILIFYNAKSHTKLDFMQSWIGLLAEIFTDTMQYVC